MQQVSPLKLVKNVELFYIIKNFHTDQSVAYPELTPFLIANLYCEVDTMVMFAANSTSYLSGVDSDIIYEIIKGSRTPPFAAPLDCIANQLLFMNSQVSILVNSLIPGLENFAANSTSKSYRRFDILW